MGFGSYDESEQREPEFPADSDDDDDETDDLHSSDHRGTVSFESGASTDDLVGRLASIMEEAEE